eukprot:scaffold1426_cov83-Cylindrotheca_fusiformis.AAC.10
MVLDFGDLWKTLFAVLSERTVVTVPQQQTSYYGAYSSSNVRSGRKSVGSSFSDFYVTQK